MFELFGRSADFTADDAARMRRIERKLDLILAHLGIAYENGDGELPADSQARADAGDKIGAIKAYRERTGAGLAEAKRAVEGYLGRRQSPNPSQASVVKPPATQRNQIPPGSGTASA